MSANETSPTTLRERSLLKGIGATAVFLDAAAVPLQTVFAQTSGPPVPTDPFKLGIASGDPTSDGLVLWTRLVRDPVHTGWRNAEQPHQCPLGSRG